MVTYYDIATIPTAIGIDYRNVDEVCGYQLLLCKIFERSGGFDLPFKTNAIIREVQCQGALWLKEVRSLIADVLSEPIKTQSISSITIASIPDLLSAYDFFYRVCTGNRCYEYLREVKLNTVDRWLRGDKAISDTDVVLLLLSETDRDILTLDKRYSDYAFSVLGEWIDELTRYGRFVSIPSGEAYKRLVYMLKDDLFAYLGRKEKQDAAKTAWTKKYVLQDHTGIDSRTLLRYIGFLLTANQWGFYSNEREDELYCRLWAEYISRPDVNPFFRLALEIDLAKYAMA